MTDTRESPAPAFTLAEKLAALGRRIDAHLTARKPLVLTYTDATVCREAERALTRAAESEQALEDVLRGFLGYTIYPDDAEIMPAAMSHVKREAYVQIVKARAARALATASPVESPLP